LSKCVDRVLRCPTRHKLVYALKMRRQKALLTPALPCEVHKALQPHPVPELLFHPQRTQPRTLLPSPPFGAVWRHPEHPRSNLGGAGLPGRGAETAASPAGSQPTPEAGDGLRHQPMGMGTSVLPARCQVPSSHRQPQTPFPFPLWHPSQELSTGHSQKGDGARSWSVQE